MTLPNPEFEIECIRRILAGEKHLFHDLIRPCERSIYFLLLSLLKNETDVEDAAQETVIKVYRNLEKFRGDSQFRTWVLSIARNEGLGRLRKINTLREDSLDADLMRAAAAWVVRQPPSVGRPDQVVPDDHRRPRET